MPVIQFALMLTIWVNGQPHVTTKPSDFVFKNWEDCFEASEAILSIHSTPTKAECYEYDVAADKLGAWRSTQQINVK